MLILISRQRAAKTEEIRKTSHSRGFHELTMSIGRRVFRVSGFHGALYSLALDATPLNCDFGDSFEQCAHFLSVVFWRLHTCVEIMRALRSWNFWWSLRSSVFWSDFCFPPFSRLARRPAG